MDDKLEKALQTAKDLCSDNNASLLYLVVFGSALYGTSSGSSDLDIRGIFLPSIQSVLLGQARKSLHFSTGKDNDKNSAEDMDIDLWSLNYWILELLPSGDTGALDLLFSPTNKDCVILKSTRLDPVFSNPMKFLDLANNKAYANYSLSQAKKYGIKGSRLGAIRTVWKWLENHEDEGRLNSVLMDIIKTVNNEKYCFLKDLPDGPGMALCGKLHTGNIKLAEFRERIKRDMEKFGERAKAAEQNEGVDYKALSHALRALDQMEELLLTGKIVYPLKTREELIKVKKGAIPWNELEPVIVSRLSQLDKLYGKISPGIHFQKDFAEKFILSCYGYTPEINKENFSEIIREKLHEIEKESNIKILYASESGSRAWGFPSGDSDFDVRFIYVHEPEWYLSPVTDQQKDVIERKIFIPDLGELDISGWDLRKTLRIFRSGNPQIAEWLNSPIVYMEKGDFAATMRSFLPSGLSMGGQWHHYHGLLKSSYKKLGNGNQSAKALLYVIRPLLIILWLESGKGIPPVHIERLLEAMITDENLKNEIRQIIEKKKFALEKDNQPVHNSILDWISKEYERMGGGQAKLDYTRQKLNLDGFFRKILSESYNF